MSLAPGREAKACASSVASRVQSRLGVANLLLIACVAIAVWLVFVPVAALIYNAFTEDTGFGPGAFSLDNFVEAYSSWHILRLLRNSLLFAVASAIITFTLGASVAWAVERTDAPGASPDDWSIRQLVEHLGKVDAMYADNIRTSVEQGRAT